MTITVTGILILLVNIDLQVIAISNQEKNSQNEQF